MYREDEFYFITDRLHFDVYNLALKKYLNNEVRVIVKVFRKNGEEVVIETINGKNITIKDTRKNKNTSILDMDLIFLKVLERYTSDYEIKGMIYEFVDGIGAWYRVKIEGFNPKDKDLKIFYNKKTVTEDIIKASNLSEAVKNKQLKFLKITKGLKFSNPNKVRKLFTFD